MDVSTTTLALQFSSVTYFKREILTILLIRPCTEQYYGNNNNTISHVDTEDNDSNILSLIVIAVISITH